MLNEGPQNSSLGHRCGGKHHIPGAGPPERGLRGPQGRGTRPKHDIPGRKHEVGLLSVYLVPHYFLPICKMPVGEKVEMVEAWPPVGLGGGGTPAHATQTACRSDASTTLPSLCGEATATLVAFLATQSTSAKTVCPGRPPLAADPPVYTEGGAHEIPCARASEDCFSPPSPPSLLSFRNPAWPLLPDSVYQLIPFISFKICPFFTGN